MSALSSVGSPAATTLYPSQVQQPSVNQNGPPGSTRWQSRLESALQGAGVDPSRIPGLEQQIQAAIQGATPSGASPGDRHAAVETAVDNVLKQNGIDPAKLKAQFKAQRAGQAGGAGKHHRGHHAKGGSGVDPTNGSPTSPTQAAQAALTGSQDGSTTNPSGGTAVDLAA